MIGTAIGAAIGGIVGGLGGGYLGYKGGRAGGDMLGGYARDHIDGVVAPSTSASRLNGYMSASPLLAGFTPMAMQGAVSAGMAQGMSGFGTSMGSNLAAAFASTQAASPSTMPAYLTSPALAPPAPPQKVDISIANGKLDVAVTVTANASSELLNVVATAKQPPAFPLQLSAVGGGSTNPAGYGSGSGSSSGSVKRFNF